MKKSEQIEVLKRQVETLMQDKDTLKDLVVELRDEINLLKRGEDPAPSLRGVIVSFRANVPKGFSLERVTEVVESVLDDYCDDADEDDGNILADTTNFTAREEQS